MSIKNQATFYFRNVCNYDSGIKADIECTKSNIDGFDAFSGLLRTIYQDWHSYEISTVPSERTKIGIMTDDLENYHNLTYTLDCLFAIAAIGELQAEGENKYLNVSKAPFKSIYKKSAAFPLEMLEKYGFYFMYFKGEKEMPDYKRCDHFHAYYKNAQSLIESIHLLATLLSKQERQKEMADKVAFMLADYYFILTGSINQNPLQDSIINTLGLVSDLWKELVFVLQDECKLTACSSFNPYVFPNRTVTFKQNNKTVCKLGINVDRLDIRLPLSFETAKELIINRKSLPQRINRNIDKFGCVDCGKCKESRNIIMVEGVSLCNLSYSNFLTEDSRCIVITISNEEETKIISDIVRRSL